MHLLILFTVVAVFATSLHKTEGGNAASRVAGHVAKDAAHTATVDHLTGKIQDHIDSNKPPGAPLPSGVPGFDKPFNPSLVQQAGLGKPNPGIADQALKGFRKDSKKKT